MLFEEATTSGLNFCHWEMELKIMWSEYFKRSLNSSSLYAGAQVCTSRLNSSAPKRASSNELAETPRKYSRIIGNTLNMANPLRAKIILQPVLSCTSLSISRFFLRRLSSTT